MKFQVSAYDIVELRKNKLPDSLENVILGLESRTIWIINKPLKHGDTFTVHNPTQALYLKKAYVDVVSPTLRIIEAEGTESIISTGSGYVMTDSNQENGPIMAWYDISGDGTVAFNGPDNDDEVTGSLEMGFSFTFLDQEFHQIRICTNGFLEFNNDDTNCCELSPLPSPAAPLNMIAAFWDDLYINSGAKVYYKTIGSPGNRQFIVQYQNVVECCADVGEEIDNLTFQVTLYEGASGAIRVQYRNMKQYNMPFAYGRTDDGDGDFPVVGLNNVDGTQGLTYTANNALPIHEGLVVGFHLDGQTPPWELAF